MKKVYHALLAAVMMMSASAVHASTVKYDYLGFDGVGGGAVSGQVSFHYPPVVAPDTTPRADLIAVVSGGPQDGRQVAISDVPTQIRRVSSGEGFYGLFGRDSFLTYGPARTAAGQIIDPTQFFGGFVWVGNPPVGSQSVAATRYGITELTVVETSFSTVSAVPLPKSLGLIMLAIGILLSLRTLGRKRNGGQRLRIA